MMTAKVVGVAVAVLMCVAGCDKPAAKPGMPTKDATAAGEHAHGAGPNGGVVFDLGKYHAEFTVDHSKQQCTIVMIGADEKTPTAVSAGELTLLINESKTAEGKVVKPMTITLMPFEAKDGISSTFVGADPGLGSVADFAGAVTGEIDGKPSQGEFKE